MCARSTSARRARWPRDIEQAVESADALLCVLSPGLPQSEWVERELLHAGEHGVPVLPLRLAPDAPLPFIVKHLQALDVGAADAGAWDALVAAVRHRARSALAPVRRIETAWLQRLLFREGVERVATLYTPLAGEQHVRPRLERVLPGPGFVPVGLDLLRRRVGAEPRESTPEPFEDVLDALATAPRLALLGEPGAGKSFSLWRAVAHYAERALKDPAAPLPLFVPLKEWIDEREPLDAFIARHAGSLAPLVGALTGAGRLALLLDGLNELPTRQRAAKAPAIERLVADRRYPVVVVSCRRDDFVDDLRLDRDTLEIRRLDPPRVHNFIAAYLRDEASTEELFWHLAAGARGAELRRVRDRWLELGAPPGAFWRVSDMSADVPDVCRATSGEEDALWHQARFDRRSLLRLAETPYTLTLLVGLYIDSGLAPLAGSRARLFEGFVEAVLAREDEAYARANEGHAHPGRDGIEAALGDLAWALQTQAGGPDNVQLAMAAADAGAHLGASQMALARSAGLLVGEDTVVFSHQLMQEYFTSLCMQARVDDGSLAAEMLWPAERWWERTGWEGATRFLAGLRASAPQALLDWLADAQPLVLADCLNEPGVEPLGDEQRADLRARWMPSLEPEREPMPEARHAVALALGRLGLDDRPGVGLRPDGSPDIAWGEAPAGEFIWQKNERRELPTFWMSRYTVTNAQFQAFVDAGGYEEARWWEGLAERVAQPRAPRWSEPNRPRTDVTWYEAVAFCRWLSAGFGVEVRLPVEREWEKAARGSDAREHPWGDRYTPGLANINERETNAGPHCLRETTAVGVYPHGASPFGIEDLAGNVWEWCLNRHEEPEAEAPVDVFGEGLRILHGGSWGQFLRVARASYRGGYEPDGAGGAVGFRVVSASHAPPGSK